MIAESAGLRIRIDGTGNVLTCRLSGDFATTFAMLERGGAHLAALRAIIPLLVRAGLRLDFVAGRLKLGTVGRGVQQNPLARLLRLPNARIGM